MEHLHEQSFEGMTECDNMRFGLTPDGNRPFMLAIGENYITFDMEVMGTLMKGFTEAAMLFMSVVVPGSVEEVMEEVAKECFGGFCPN